MRAAVVTVSTSRHRGDGGEDESGAALLELCGAAGLDATQEVVPDERYAIASVLERLADVDGVRFVFTTGGTGMTAHDVTPQAPLRGNERGAPGHPRGRPAEGGRPTPLRNLTRRGAATPGRG